MDNQLLSTRPKPGYGIIYCYTSPSGKKYVGQTKTTLKERLKLNAKGYKGCPYFYKAIQKYGIENFEVEILSEVPLDVLHEEEHKMIWLYGTTNREIGYNLDSGEYQYISSLNAIPVYQYDETTGQFVNSFPSIAEASHQLEVHHTSIRKAMNQPDKKSANSYWRTEKFDKVETSTKWNQQPHSKKIYRYNSNTGDYIDEFNSVREAHRITGVSRPTIQSHILGKVKKGKDFFFTEYKVDNLYSESSTTISKESTFK